jgi:hypothetical protein
MQYLHQVRSKVRKQVDVAVWDVVNGQVRSGVYDHIGFAVWDAVNGQVRDAVENTLKEYN